MKNIFHRPSKKLDSITNTCKNPWLITTVSNGLKAVNGKPTTVKFFINHKLDVKYYEYDRIFGRKAFESQGILKVTDLFDELKEVTPLTEYFIFKDHDYINRHDGILRKNHKTGEETFYSNETLRNENLANYFTLEYNEADIDRSTVHDQSTELQRI